MVMRMMVWEREEPSLKAVALVCGGHGPGAEGRTTSGHGSRCLLQPTFNRPAKQRPAGRPLAPRQHARTHNHAPCAAHCPQR